MHISFVYSSWGLKESVELAVLCHRKTTKTQQLFGDKILL